MKTLLEAMQNLGEGKPKSIVADLMKYESDMPRIVFDFFNEEKANIVVSDGYFWFEPYSQYTEISNKQYNAVEKFIKKIFPDLKSLSELKESKDGDYIVYRGTTQGPLYLSDTTNTTFNKSKAVRFPTEEEAKEALHDYIETVTDPEANDFKIARLNEKKLNEDEEKPLANESETFKNISDSLVNYSAFTANFGPVVKVLKFQGDYLIYKSEAKNYDEYIYKADNKDEIEGWLYGCVMVANNIIKPLN